MLGRAGDPDGLRRGAFAIIGLAMLLIAALEQRRDALFCGALAILTNEAELLQLSGCGLLGAWFVWWRADHGEGRGRHSM